MKKLMQVVTMTVIIFVSISMVVAPLRVDATYPVIDWTAIGKIAKEIQVLESQLRALEEMKKHLNPMNMAIFTKCRNFISNAFSKLASLRNSVKGLTFNYSKVEEVWNKTYKKAEGFGKMKDSDYAIHLRTLDEQTSNALLDAMKAQSLISDIDADKERLEELMDESKSAKGMLQAMQVGNQINSLQINQLVRMQTIMAMSYRAQTMYYQWEMQEKMSQRIYAEKNKIQFDNPMKSVSFDSGFPQF